MPLISDPIDLLLDLDGDIDVSSGAPRLSTGQQAVKQGIQIAIQLIKGEWYLNLDAGLPHFENATVTAAEAIMGQRFDEIKALAAYRAAILSVPGVASLDSLTITFEGTTRVMTVRWHVLTTFGDTVADVIAVGA